MNAPPDQVGEHQFYTISEAARLLQVSQAMVWRWIQAADYDPQLTRQALAASAGTLVGIDRDLLMADLGAQREQDSHGRPA